MYSIGGDIGCVRARARVLHACMHVQATWSGPAIVADSDRARRQLASQVVGLRLSRERLAALAAGVRVVVAATAPTVTWCCLPVPGGRRAWSQGPRLSFRAAGCAFRLGVSWCEDFCFRIFKSFSFKKSPNASTTFACTSRPCVLCQAVRRVDRRAVRQAVRWAVM